MTEDRAFNLDATVKFAPPLLGWSLRNIEWSSDDATAKTIKIYHHPQGLPHLTYPPIIFGTTANTETEFITIFEENEADYGQGDELEIEVDGTTDKKLWVVVVIQMNRVQKIPTETPIELQADVQRSD